MAAELQIRILARDQASQAYPVEALLDDGSFYSGEALQLDRRQLRRLELDSAPYGQALFDALFVGSIGRAFEKATGRAQALYNGELRIRLWIDRAAAELHAIPWERLYLPLVDGQPAPLAASSRTPFSRFVRLEMPAPTPITERPIRVLVAVSNPTNLPEQLPAIDVGGEIENLRQALAGFRQASQIEVTIMAGRTGLPAELAEQLRSESYRVLDEATTLDNLVRHLAGQHIFYFIGHATLSRLSGQLGEGQTAVFLEGDDGRFEVATDSSIMARLESLTPLPQLILLHACETAARAEEDEHPFVGLGPKLIQAGVPAVVAMQARVPVRIARELARDFLRYLTQHGIVDRALNQARLLLYREDETAWSIPVLFMRLTDGRLFASDPVQSTLQAMRASPDYHLPADELPLPVEVVRLEGTQDVTQLEPLRFGHPAAQPLVDTALAIMAGRYRPADRPPGSLVLILGDRGSAKSAQLRRIAHVLSLALDETMPFLPVYLDLRQWGYGEPGVGRSLESLLRGQLAEYWPGLTPAVFDNLLRGLIGVSLALLIDGSDDLPEARRRAAWREVQKLANAYPRPPIVLLSDRQNYQGRWIRPTDILLIQPLAQRRIRHFLEQRDDKASRRLLREIDDRQLYDLAAVPWLLVHMVRQAEANNYPQSRTDVLASWMDSALADIPTDLGIRARARPTLYALAWAMQSRRQSRLAVDEAYAVMSAERGRREYGFAELTDRLSDAGLLARIGDESIRFVYPPVQAYCCAQAIAAMADREGVLDDITATLGRLSRLRWWEDTLVFLCGLLRRPRTLLQQILYGVNLLESEQVFLAVRCILEMRRQQVPDELRSQVVDALIWRLDALNEPSASRRIRAAQALGELRDDRSVPFLARAANARIRHGRGGEPEYERSDVRLAAVLSLYRMMPAVADPVRQDDPFLADLLEAWHARREEQLLTYLRGTDEAAKVLAAYALADWQPLAAFDEIVAAFLAQPDETQVSWALAEALALFESERVARRAVLPLLDADRAARAQIPASVWERRANWYRVLAYLIGKIRAQEPICREFLARCLTDSSNMWLRGKAIEALGRLYDYSQKEAFEALAAGSFESIQVPEGIPPREAQYLQTKALLALGFIGDAATLSRLGAERTGWPTALVEAYYQTSEEIYWRLSTA